jgi:hypothetical protein
MLLNNSTFILRTHLKCFLGDFPPNRKRPSENSSQQRLLQLGQVNRHPETEKNSERSRLALSGHRILSSKTILNTFFGFYMQTK